MKEIEFLKKYSDYEAANAWRKVRLDDADAPPAAFAYGEGNSKSIKWSKTVQKEIEHVDFPDAGPRRRIEIKTNYVADGLSAETTVTSYPDYPVVEFQTRLKNTSAHNSPVIKNLLAIDDYLTAAKGTTVHYNKGSRYSVDDFRPYISQMGVGSTLELCLDNGKPTSVLLPNFNAETGDGGVIAVMGWQGCWKASFRQEDAGLHMAAGQNETEFVLFPGEEYRTPLMVLLFYKGGFIDGQNIWRRWFYNHNQLRKQGVRFGKNAITCVGDIYEGMMGNAKDDMKHIDDLAAAGMETVIDYFVQDAGWHDCDTARSWVFTGNWYAPVSRYPSGIREVTDYARAHGIRYAMWIEPERIIYGSKSANELGGKVIAFEDVPGKGPRWLPFDQRVPGKTTVLVNYAEPEAVDYTIDMIDQIITTYGLDMYRQDFNIFPAPFWRAEEAHLSDVLGVPRLGVVEEKYTAGYLRLFSTLVDRHPGMVIDACASGGMRIDLETMRMAFPHTRTDYYADIVGSQNMTYGMAMWYVLMGGGPIDITDPYDRRSRLFTSIGSGAGQHTFLEWKKGLEEWQTFVPYMMFDFYQLSGFDAADKGVMAMQFNDPDGGRGLAAVYVRKETDGSPFLLKLSNLDEDARYKVHMIETPDEEMVMTGKQLMSDGIVVGTTIRSHACLYFYKKA
jgi:alpha-galactosidase